MSTRPAFALTPVVGDDASEGLCLEGLDRADRAEVFRIVRTVSVCLGVHVRRITCRERVAPVAWARQVCIWLLRGSERLDLSENAIGRIFGRDHGTVAHAFRAVEADRATHPKRRAQVDEILAALHADPKPTGQVLVWVDAAKEFPDDAETVLISLSDGEVWTGFRDAGDWRFVCGELVDQGDVTTVTHWAQFPAPPTATAVKGAR